MTKFQLGSLVSRRKNVFDPKSKLLHGIVTEIYSDYTSLQGPYPELYEVTWSNGMIERGFLLHGLDKED